MPRPAFVLSETGYFRTDPKPTWTVLDRQGVENGHYDFAGADRAQQFLQEHGLYGPYVIAPIDPTGRRPAVTWRAA